MRCSFPQGERKSPAGAWRSWAGVENTRAATFDLRIIGHAPHGTVAEQ
jgi:hypothetical protein